VSAYTVHPDGTVTRMVGHVGNRRQVDVVPVATIRLKCERCGWSPVALRDSGLPHPEFCSCGGRLVAGKR
jgi:hypothetical protein